MLHGEILNNIISPPKHKRTPVPTNLMAKKGPFTNIKKPMTSGLGVSEDLFVPVQKFATNMDIKQPFNLMSFEKKQKPISKEYLNQRHQSTGKWVYSDQRTKAKWDKLVDGGESPEPRNFLHHSVQKQNAFPRGSSLPKIASVQDRASKAATDINIKPYQDARQTQNQSQISTSGVGDSDIDKQYSSRRNKVPSGKNFLKDGMFYKHHAITNSELTQRHYDLMTKRPEKTVAVPCYVSPTNAQRLPTQPKSYHYGEYYDAVGLSDLPKTPEAELDQRRISTQNQPLPDFYQGNALTDGRTSSQKELIEYQNNRRKDFYNLPKMNHKFEHVTGQKRWSHCKNNTNVEIQTMPMKFQQLGSLPQSVERSQERGGGDGHNYKKGTLCKRGVLDQVQLTNRETIDKSYKSPIDPRVKRRQNIVDSVAIINDHLHIKRRPKNDYELSVSVRKCEYCKELHSPERLHSKSSVDKFKSIQMNKKGSQEYLKNQVQPLSKKKQAQIQELKKKINEKKKIIEETKKKQKKTVQKRQLLNHNWHMQSTEQPSIESKRDRDTSRDLGRQSATVNNVKYVTDESSIEKWNNTDMDRSFVPPNESTIVPPNESTRLDDSKVLQDTQYDQAQDSLLENLNKMEQRDDSRHMTFSKHGDLEEDPYNQDAYNQDMEDEQQDQQDPDQADQG